MPQPPRPPPLFKLVFPLARPATEPYWDKKHHQESFGWRRAGGKRLHAGVDLVAPVGTRVLAVADGRVVRTAKRFYQGTGVIEISHPGLGVFRYGEVDPESIATAAGFSVKAGEPIAMVGKLIGSARSMLHLEWYEDETDDSPLTVPDNAPYKRRAGLRDPTLAVSTATLAAFRRVRLPSPLDGVFG